MNLALTTPPCLHILTDATPEKPRGCAVFRGWHLLRCVNMVPEAGVEPARYRYHWILSFPNFYPNNGTWFAFADFADVPKERKDLSLRLKVRKFPVIAGFPAIMGFVGDFCKLEGHRRDIGPFVKYFNHTIGLEPIKIQPSAIDKLN